jgi:hypothetical protein
MTTIQQIADELIQQHDAMAHGNDTWDRKIVDDLLQPKDENADFITGSNYYLWYNLIGWHFEPKSILEMGTRYGYSLKALTDGAGWAPVEYRIRVIDDERDGDKTLDVFLEYFKKKGFKPIEVLPVDTQSLPVIRFLPANQFDFAHVDAWHTEPGVYHECNLALGYTKPGGVILVDDTNPGPVRDGTERFCKERNLDFAFLPTLRGMHIIQIPLPDEN